MLKWRYYQLDDALIYLRYIRNFQEGHGLVYNQGEKFNGLTSPLFTYLMLAGSLLTKNLQALNILMSAVMLSLAAWVAGKLLSQSWLGAMLSALAIASFGFFYTTFGMETSLFLLLIALSLYLYQRESDWFLVALALLISTRSEGVFLALPMGIDYLWRNRRLPAWHVILVAIAVGTVPFLVNWLYYGHPLPATGGAKIGQGKSGLWGTGWIFFKASYLWDLVFSGNRIVGVGLLFAAIVGAWFSRSRRITTILLVFVVLLMGFYGGLNIPNYHWYYAPFFFISLIFACHAMEKAVLAAMQISSVGPRLILLLVLVGVTAYAWTHVLKLNGHGRHRPYTLVGEWLNANTPAHASVATVEIGHIGWYSNRHIVDILGLTNSYNADFIAQRDTFSWLTKYQPDYILRHEPRWGHEKSTELLESLGFYSSVKDFKFKGYVLLQKSPDVHNKAIVNAVEKHVDVLESQ